MRRLQTKTAATVAILLAAAVPAIAACGKTNSTGNGVQFDDPAGNGRDGGSGDAANGGASGGDGGGFAGGGTSGTGGGTSGTGGGDAGSGETGGNGAGAGDGSGGSTGGSEYPFPDGGRPSPVACDAPPPPAPSTPEGDARALLIEGYCALLEQYPCLGTFYGEASDYARTCDVEARVAACELDVTLEYQQFVPAGCDDEWHASIACATGVDYAAVCAGSAYPRIMPILYPEIDGNPCASERQALHDCTDQESAWPEVTGARATCSYHVAANNPGICEVYCNVGSTQSFMGDCSGSATGGPYDCGCWLNGNPLLDGEEFNPSFFSSTCEDAAQRMADGECIERTDCCFTWKAGSDDHCSCTSDPTYFGHETCAEAAAAGGGSVVDLCPRYEDPWGGL